MYLIVFSVVLFIWVCVLFDCVSHLDIMYLIVFGFVLFIWLYVLFYCVWLCVSHLGIWVYVLLGILISKFVLFFASSSRCLGLFAEIWVFKIQNIDVVNACFVKIKKDKIGSSFSLLVCLVFKFWKECLEAVA